VVGDLGVKTQARTNTMTIAVRRVIHIGRYGRGARDHALRPDVLRTITDVAATLDPGRPVGALHLREFVRRDCAFFTQFLGLGLQVVHFRLTAVGQCLQLRVLRLEVSVGRLEAVETLGERLHL
jgi:hypothetical protein